MIIKFLPYIAAVLLLLGTYTIGHIKGTSSCEIGNAKKEAAIVVKGEKEHSKIQQNVMTLTDKKLNIGLSRFMRD